MIDETFKRNTSKWLDLMTERDRLQSIRDEFDRRIEGKPYESLNALTAPVQGRLDSKERSQYECCIHAAMEHFGIKDHEA